MSHPVSRLQTQYPGIIVLSDVQAHALLGEHEEGLKAFFESPSPTPSDYRWKGVCHFSLFQDDEAINAYEHAISLGAQAARINLAHSLAFVDRSHEIGGQLEQVSFDDLSLYDQVFYLRVKSLNDERNGELHVALRQAEHAWRLIQGAPEFSLLAPQLLNQLGILHGRIGRAQRALWYLDRNLELAEGDANTRVRLTRLRVLNTLGRLEEARHEFELLGELPPQYLALVRIRGAELSWAEGDTSQAIAAYKEAVSAAQELGQSFEEFQASIDLAVLKAHFSNSPNSVDELMQRAQTLVADRSDRLLYRFREILILSCRGSYIAEHTAAELATVSRQFGEMGLLQEQGWVDGHRAKYLHESGSVDQSQRVLESLRALASTLQNPAYLAREWHLMPEFVHIVHAYEPSITSAVFRTPEEAGG